MSDQFGKIVQKIYRSSLIFDHGKDAVYVMMSLVVLSDKDGVINDDPRAIAQDIGMSLDDLEPILEILQQPDPKSNITDYEGRRIIPLSECDQFPGNRGYRVVNKPFYRDQGNPSTSKERVAKHRKKQEILKIFSELNYCNVTVTLPDEIVTILSVYVSVSISIEIIKYLIESDIDLYAWAQYEDYRKKALKSPLKTDQGRKKLINILKGRSQDEQRKIIQQTFDHEWKGLFEVKDDGKNRQSGRTGQGQSSASRLWNACANSIH